MSNFLEFLRQQNIFGPTSGLPPPPNSIPQSIMGPGVMDSSMQPPPGTDLTPFIPPPQFSMSGINAPDVGMNPMEQPFQNVQFGKGPLDINQFDIQQARQGPPEMDAGARMRELYKPSTGASDRFDQMIAQYPQEDKPSWLRRIGAMLVDYTKGSKQGQEFFHEPYNQKVEEWKNKIGPAQQSANLERYENVNQRTLAYQTIATELREKAQEAKERNDVANTQIRQHRADIYAFKAMHPNFKFIMPKGGNVMAMDPATGQSHDTGIPTGSLTELDKMNIGQDQALERIGETGAQARQTEGVRQEGRLEAIDARGEQARQTRATPVGGKSELPTQYRVRVVNAAAQLKNSRPELAKFIKVGVPGSNDIEIAKPGQNFIGKPTGPTPDQYSEIINAIYGPVSKPITPVSSHGSNFTPRSTTPSPTPTSTTPSPTSTTTKTIRVEVNGKTFRFQGTPQEAIAAGYKVIGQ